MYQNYEKALEDIRKVTHNWMYKYMTIFRKVTVVKSLVLRKVTHIASVLPTPSSMFCELFDEAINKFVQGKNQEGKNNFIP